MQIENENINPDTVNPDTSKTVFKLNGFEVSMTEAEKGVLLEKLSTWKSKLVKFCVCLVIAGLLSLIPFGAVGKSLITRGQEWVQSIQVEIEANKQLKQEQIEKEKAEKAAKEAERVAQEAEKTAKEVEKTEETPNALEDFKQTLQIFQPIIFLLRITSVIVLVMSVVRLVASMCLEDAGCSSSSLMITIAAAITLGLTLLF